MFGRGTADMKGGLASMLYAAVALQRVRAPLDGRVGLVFVPDEETGGRRGSGFLAAAKRLGSNGIGMLTPEPTSGVVWNANRGALTVRVTVHGREAHVGLLHQGRNAFEDALRVVAGLQRLARRVQRRRTRFRVTPDAARRSLMLIGGRVEAGSNFNVVPGRCVFTVDRRINPEEDFETERQVLFDVFAAARRAGVSLDVEVFQEGRPAGTSEATPLGRALSTHVRAVTGRAPTFEMCPGLLEIRFYAEHGMPAYAYGPGLLSVSHGPKEFVHIDRIVECAAVYARTAATVLRRSEPREHLFSPSARSEAVRTYELFPVERRRFFVLPPVGDLAVDNAYHDRPVCSYLIGERVLSSTDLRVLVEHQVVPFHTHRAGPTGGAPEETKQLVAAAPHPPRGRRAVHRVVGEQVYCAAGVVRVPGLGQLVHEPLVVDVGEVSGRTLTATSSAGPPREMGKWDAADHDGGDNRTHEDSAVHGQVPLRSLRIMMRQPSGQV